MQERRTVEVVPVIAKSPLLPCKTSLAEKYSWKIPETREKPVELESIIQEKRLNETYPKQAAE